MPYSTDEDLFDRLSEDQVRRLSDDEGLGEVNETLVGRLRDEASQYIDAYLRGHYALPMSDPPPPILTQIEVSLLASRLYARRPNIEVPESVKQAKEDALDDLGRIGKGRLALDKDVAMPDEDDDGPGTYEVRSEDATLKEEMERY